MTTCKGWLCHMAKLKQRAQLGRLPLSTPELDADRRECCVADLLAT